MLSRNEAAVPNGHPLDPSLPDHLTSRKDEVSVEELAQACKEAKDVSIVAELASSVGGLQDDRVRRVACMFGNLDRILLL